ncbi:MAG: NAD(P)/FAD-dependent oxidoreductase [Candidatus Omnitrophica bacterium]|nr:NAD(P)/FAD-dependent oxidoreductase [Candidatus Omnitrophota bacterium]
MKIYDIAVIGAGPAGAMAAIRAAQLGKRVILIERNDAIGRKLLLTGKGRCNITNSAPLDTFVEKFGRQGNFLRSAFFKFFNEDLTAFFRAKGLEMKTERQGRVFPVTDDSRAIVKVLDEYLSGAGVEMRYNSRVKKLHKREDLFRIELESGSEVEAARVIMATGGSSYKATGSAGDGFHIAEHLGHTIAKLKPGLVPLKTEEHWVKGLQGLALENIRLTFECGRKKIVSDIGELMFTHFGVSGPLVLDLSGDIVDLLEQHDKVGLLIDLKPGLTAEQLDRRLLNEFKDSGTKSVKNIFKALLPLRLIDAVIEMAGVDHSKRGSQISQEERRRLVRALKGLRLTVTGALALEEAMVTGGGVSARQIDPRTMESKVVPGLYFAGEVIEGCAASGGYNLQQAFSTGHLAGESAAHA